jgi:hypothetical protein
MANCRGCEAHQRAIARTLRIRTARNGIACALEPNEGLTRGISNIKAGSCAGVFPASPPPAEPLHQIALIQVIAGKERIGQAECHCRVIGPLARFQPKRTAAYHVDYWLLRVAYRKFQRRSDCVSNR